MRLADYRGKMLLLVNVASKCDYTQQHAALQALYEKYRGLGRHRLSGQELREPGAGNKSTDQGILLDPFRCDFPFVMSAKISVPGADIHPLYQFLTTGPSRAKFAGKITWNFNNYASAGTAMSPVATIRLLSPSAANSSQTGRPP
jgi:glutathione peroxidase